MMKIYNTFKNVGLALLLFFMSSAVMGQNKLIISQYVETNTGSVPKGIELWNVSGGTIDFSVTNLEIMKGTNGAATASDFILSTGTIADGEVMVIGTADMGTYLTNEGLTSVLFAEKAFTFNGDDALEVFLDGIKEDVFGDPGTGDPGTGWSGNGVNTFNESIQLIGGITTGDTDGWTDPSTRFETVSISIPPALTGFGLVPMVPCTAPSTQASAINFSSIGDNTTTVNWTGGDGDDGVIVLVKEGTAIDANPTSGSSYTANAAFGSGDQIGTGNYVVYVGGVAGADNVAVTGLTQGTTYHYAVYELNATDVCYLTPGLAGSQATTSSVDSDSDITDPTSQVTGANISSLINDAGSAVDVFSFKLTDAGTADGIATNVSTIVIEKGTNNTVADWSSIIAGAVLNDGSSDLTVTSTNINTNDITFDLTGNEYAVANGTSKEITLSIYLASSVTDDEILEFEIPTTHGFGADANGSGFKTTLTGAITSNQFTIDVTATAFDGSSSSTVVINEDFTASVSAVDANGNIDKAARAVSISLGSGTGNLSSITGLSGQAMTNGTLTWTDLRHDTEESITLTIDDDGSALTFTSGAIDVIDLTNLKVFISEVADPSDVANAKFVELYNAGASSVNLDGFYLSRQSNGGSWGNIALSGSIAAGSTFVIANNSTNYDAEFGMTANQYNTTVSSNGDDGYFIYYGTQATGTLIDAYGVIDQDGTGFEWEFLDSRAVRNYDVIAPSTTWTASEWTVDFPNTIAVAGFDPSVHFACAVPSTQATAVTFGTTDETSMVVNWTQGNGDMALVMVKSGGAVDADPEPGTAYTANANFTTGEVFGAGNIVVFAGTSATQTVTVTNLTAATEYHVAVYEYNSTDNCYNLTSPAINSNTTNGSDVIAPTISSAATATVTIANTIDITFSESVTTTDEAGFTINIDASAATITGLTGSGTNTLTFTISEDIGKGSAVTIDYNDATGDAQDGAANALASFTSQAVTNNASFNLVTNIGDLVALANGEGVKLTGTAIVYAKQSFRNQKWIQDGTSAILIDDSNGNLGTDYAVGDEMPGGLEGTINVFNGLYQIVPSSGNDPGTALNTGQTVTPTVVSLATFNSDFLTLQNKLITVSEVTFDNAGTAFSNGTDFGITSGSDNGTYRTYVFNFSGNQPYGRVDITAPAGVRNNAPFIFGRGNDDIVDNYAPLFTVAPASSNITTSGFTVTFQADEPGTVYYVVNENATAPSLATILAGTSQAYTATTGINVTVSVSGLTDGTQYYMHLLAADDESSPNEQSVAATVSATTQAIVFDGDSDISAPTTQVAAADVSSLANDAGSLVDVFTFKITDAGSGDGQATTISQIVIEAGANNSVADWSTVIAGVNLNDGTNDLTATSTIGTTDITFDLTGNELVVTDASTLEIKLSIFINSTVTDGEVLEFEIPMAHGFVAAATTGSVFPGSIGADVTSNLQTIQVEATSFDLTAPANAQLSTNFAVTATAQDANGNVDLAARDVSVSVNTGSGTLSSATGLASQAMVAGVYSWTDLQHDAEETITLDITDGSITSTTGDIMVSTVATNLEDFTNYPEVGGSYVDGTFVGNDGSTWTYVQSRGDQVITGATPMLGKDRTPAASITSGTIANGIGTLSFDYMQAFSTSVNLEVYVNDLLVETITSGGVAGVIENTRDIAVDVAGDFVLSFRNPAGGGQVNIDNVTWTSFNASAPTITVDAAAFNGDFGPVTVSTNSASSSFTVSGSNLTADITVTAPAGFAVSTDDITFDDFVTLTQSGGTLAATTIYAHFIPDAAQAFTGNITITSAGANDKTVAVSGTGLSASSIYFEDFSSCDMVNYNAVSVVGDQVWSCNTNGQTGDGARMNGYSGGALDNEDWLITNAIDLSAATNATLTFYSDVAFPTGSGLEVFASSDYSGTGAPSAATWTSLSALLDTDGGNGTWLLSGDLDLQSFVGGDVYVAFKYTSSTAGAAQWTIDDILVEDRDAVANPTVTVTAALSDFGTVNNAAASASQSFTVEGTDLAGDITITAPANFEVSLDDAAFDNFVSVTPTSGTVASTTIHVRFVPTSGINGALSGNITVSSTNAVDQSIAVSGTEDGNTVIEGDLYFSQYIEGSSSNRALEIYNGTGADVDLSNYSVKQSHNGLGFDNDVPDAYDLPLSGTLSVGDVYIIYNDGATDATILAEGDLMLTYGDVGGARNASFTGDDAIGLFKNGTLIDLIGDPNNDPGTGWDVAGVPTATVDHTLVRKASVTTGNTTALGSFGTSAADSEWEVLDLDDMTGLGSHNGSSEPVATIALDQTGFSGNFGDVTIGTTTASRTYKVSGTDLSADITVTAPEGYEVSLDDATFSPSVTIAHASGVVAATSVHVRFVPTAAITYNGDITHVSGATSQNLSLAGTGIEEVTGVSVDMASNVQLYPNPTKTGEFTIAIPTGKEARVSLIATNGSVKTFTNVSGKATLNVADLTNGLYVVRVVMDKQVTTKKIVINK